MLRGLTDDLQASGHRVTALLDSRIAAVHPPLNADHIVQVAFPGGTDLSMKKAAESADAAYVIAPESSHLLQSIVECVENTGTLSLNCESSAIKHVSDKTALSRRTKQLGLDFPKTVTFNANDYTQETSRINPRDIGYPMIIKPGKGAGCNGISLVQNETHIDEAVRKAKTETATTNITAQEFVEGIPISVSLVSIGPKALPVSLNLQNVTLAPPNGCSTYNGGLIPFEHPLRSKAFAAAKRLIESFGNLRGYMGVDMVLTAEKAFVIEVNPRLTTSYVGLRKTVNFNLAQAIIDSVLKDTLSPSNPKHNGYACFSKVPVCQAAIPNLSKTLLRAEALSPPFPIMGESIAYALLLALGTTANEAYLRLNETKQLHQIKALEKQPW